MVVDATAEIKKGCRFNNGDDGRKENGGNIVS